jgi:hypothetical protein
MRWVVGHGVCVFLFVTISIGVQCWRWMMAFKGDGDGFFCLTEVVMVPQGSSEQQRQLRELS